MSNTTSSGARAKRVEDSRALFREGYNCSQSVLMPQAEAEGMEASTAALLASGFGGGMGRLQLTCGALTGAFMALGLLGGYTDSADGQGKARVTAEVKGLAAAFKAKFGALDCLGLLGCDLNTEAGQKLHKDEGQREKICLECVAYAASLVEEARQRQAQEA